MNPFLNWFATPEWLRIVETLLHSLWQGVIVAAGLAIALRQCRHPGLRYRLALTALIGLVAASLITWSVLQQGQPAVSSRATGADAKPFVQNSSPGVQDNPATGVSSPNPDLSVPVQTAESASVAANTAAWSAWLAVFWMLGAAMMLVRAGRQVAGAGQIRRACQPLTDGPVPGLLAEVQKTLGLLRPIRVLVTEQLTSPAVTGVLIPVLVLPLSLVSTFSPEQLRFILLHELAHIRRGDYWVNLFQLLIEALLFFNPAVWWISRQIRLEREACCDAVAVELSGAPAEYARTLLRVAEQYAYGPETAMAFGGPRKPSNLAERIHRLLVPGHRPHLRLTWRGMLASLVAGGTLLLLSAVGTRMTVAAILTPEQRMDQIEKTLAAHGEPVPAAQSATARGGVSFSGHLRTEDGSPLPKNIWIDSKVVLEGNTSLGPVNLEKNDGAFHGTCPNGMLTLCVEVPGFAPCQLGPIAVMGTNAVTGLEMVLRRGFAVTIQLADAESGAPIANASLSAHFDTARGYAEDRSLITDSQGAATFTNCADLPLQVTVNAPEWEMVQKTFPSLVPGQTLHLTTRRGAVTSGVVLDQATGRPLAGAAINLIRQQGAEEMNYAWETPGPLLATSDATGHFAIARLRRDSRYQLGIYMAGHGLGMIEKVLAGESNIVARLGPELKIHGRVTGAIKLALNDSGRPEVQYTVTDPETHNGRGYEAESWLTNGEIDFQFTNPVAGTVELTVAGQTWPRLVAAPEPDWHVELTNVLAANPAPKMRELIVRLKSKSGVAPRGAIEITAPAPPPASYDSIQRVALKNGEARLNIPVGAGFQFGPSKTTVGFWFNSGLNWTNMPPGDGPLVIEVPAIPAGVITARARNPDGSPAGGLFFTLQVLKQSPAVDNEFGANFDSGDGFSDSAPRQYVTSPLPLGGKYEIIGWRDNAMCVSEPVKLTEASPDQSVELKFAPGQDLTGRVLAPDGRPLQGVCLSVKAEIEPSHGFQLKKSYTDVSGQFVVSGCNPDVAQYSLDISEPRCVQETVKVNFSRQPLTVQLKPGHVIAGQVVDDASGYAVANEEMRTFRRGSEDSVITTRTDASGHFEFNTLHQGTYDVFVDNATVETKAPDGYVADQATNLLLRVTAYSGTQLTLNRPQ